MNVMPQAAVQFTGSSTRHGQNVDRQLRGDHRPQRFNAVGAAEDRQALPSRTRAMKRLRTDKHCLLLRQLDRNQNVRDCSFLHLDSPPELPNRHLDGKDFRRPPTTL